MNEDNNSSFKFFASLFAFWTISHNYVHDFLLDKITAKQKIYFVLATILIALYEFLSKGGLLKKFDKVSEPIKGLFFLLLTIGVPIIATLLQYFTPSYYDWYAILCFLWMFSIIYISDKSLERILKNKKEDAGERSENKIMLWIFVACVLGLASGSFSAKVVKSREAFSKQIEKQKNK